VRADIWAAAAVLAGAIFFFACCVVPMVFHMGLFCLFACPLYFKWGFSLFACPWYFTWGFFFIAFLDSFCCLFFKVVGLLLVNETKDLWSLWRWLYLGFWPQFILTWSRLRRVAFHSVASICRGFFDCVMIFSSSFRPLLHRGYASMQVLAPPLCAGQRPCLPS